jgi:hypothetical protein
VGKVASDEQGEGTYFDTGFYKAAFAHFEAMGEDLARQQLSVASLPMLDRVPARVWLGRKARESTLAIVGKIEIAERQAAAADRASRKVNTALVITGISALAAIILVAVSIAAIHPFR